MKKMAITPMSQQNKFEVGPQEAPTNSMANVNVGPEFTALGADSKMQADQSKAVLPPFMRTLLGQPNTPDMISPEQRATEHKMWIKRQRMAEFKLEEEKASLERRKQELEYRVVSLKEELQVMTKEAGAMAYEIDKATFIAPVAIGTYDESFFEHLRTMLVNIRKKITKAKQWLALHNARAAKKSQKHPFMKQNNKMQVDAYQSNERKVSFGG